MRTDWIPTNVGQWLNRFLVRIESYFLLCIFYLAGFWLVKIGGFPFRKCKAKSKTQFEPESDSATGQHLLEFNQCARNYSHSQFKILTTARSQFYLSLLEAVYISRKKTDLCRQKQFVFTLQLFR